MTSYMRVRFKWKLIFIVNVETIEGARRGRFILNNYVLFRVNNTTFSIIQKYSVLFRVNNTSE